MSLYDKKCQAEAAWKPKPRETNPLTLYLFDIGSKKDGWFGTYDTNAR